MTRIDVNGISLNVRVTGDGPPLLLLHGFTGSAGTWSSDDWGGYTAIAVDLIGHGESDSPAEAQRYTMQHCVADLVALLDRLDVARAAVLGYSMGGRVALQLALHLSQYAPERLSALVLESVSPGIEDDVERAGRRRGDAGLAESIERDGIEAFVGHWQSIPLFASQARLPADVRARLRAQRLANSQQGLANSLRGMGAGEEPPVFDRLREIAAPALVVAGAADAKYRRLAERTAAALPNARLAVIADAGHAVHLEQPRAFTRAVRRFLHAHVQQKEQPACR